MFSQVNGSRRLGFQVDSRAKSTTDSTGRGCLAGQTHLSESVPNLGILVLIERIEVVSNRAGEELRLCKCQRQASTVGPGENSDKYAPCGRIVSLDRRVDRLNFAISSPSMTMLPLS